MGPVKLPPCLGRGTGVRGVLAELLRALPVAVMVGTVPGYFWARSLSPVTDRVELLAYSTALSATLVPTAALLQARIFGTGVTLPIAAVSAAAVFATGLAHLPPPVSPHRWAATLLCRSWRRSGSCWPRPSTSRPAGSGTLFRRPCWCCSRGLRAPSHLEIRPTGSNLMARRSGSARRWYGVPSSRRWCSCAVTGDR
jgi:hypothetical protein